MGYLVTRMKSGNMSYSGTQYVNPTNGTKRLCIRTGTKPTDIVKYGLTTNSSASNYCGMRMKIDGKTAYIGRSEVPIQPNYYSNSTISSRFTYSSSFQGGMVGMNTMTSSAIRVRTSTGQFLDTVKVIASGSITSSTTTVLDDNLTASNYYNTQRVSFVISSLIFSTPAYTTKTYQSVTHYSITKNMTAYTLSFPGNVNLSRDNFNL